MPSSKLSKTFIAVSLTASLVGALYFLRSSPKSSDEEASPSEESASTGLALEIPEAPKPSEPLPVPSEVPPAVKLQVLKEILDSKNDNDPRLDSEFGNLSDESKKDLRNLYGQRAEEDRNGRGTIVFLLGRAIDSIQDVDFFEEVLREKECQSLENCSADVRLGQGHSEEHDSVNDLTLAYPQIVALQMLEKNLQKDLDPGLRRAIKDALRAGEKSLNPQVARRSIQILDQHFRP